MPHISEVLAKVAFSIIDRDMPTSARDDATETVYVAKIRLANRTGGALTVTIKDKSTTPVEKYTAVSIAANTVSLELMSDWPETFVDGINVVASATGISYTIEGRKEPA